MAIILIITIILIVLFTAILLVEYFYRNYLKKSKREKFILKNHEETIKLMRDKKLYIGVLARDIETKIPLFLDKMKKLSPYFTEIEIFFSENDSIDKTRQLLLDEVKNNTSSFKVNLVNEKQLNLPSYFLPKFKKTKAHEKERIRIEKMVFLRNDLLNSIKVLRQPSKNDYLLITDADLIGEFEMEGIFDTFDEFFKKEEIEAIGFRGIKRHPFITDLIPFYDFFDDYALSGVTANAFVGKYYDGLIKVESSFSGGIFYRFPINSEYSYEEKNNKPICEHITLNRNLNMFVNTNMIYTIKSH